MQHKSIAVGQRLKLKPARRAAYGLAVESVTVTAIQPRPGYSVPWIRCGEMVFAPSDFARVIS